MVMLLGTDVHPHFKHPKAQGWALHHHKDMVGWLRWEEAKHIQNQR